MGIENLRNDIQRKTLEPKKKQSQHERRKSEERYFRRQNEREKRANYQMVKRITSCTVGVLLLGVIVLLRYNMIFGLQSDIKDVNGQIKVLSEGNEDLNIKISEGLSLEKIEKIAADELNMIYPKKEDVVNIVP
ncbi:hypothetical protein [uncultured Clostridium sp.]|jgi:cell division protein FtsL|uniref:hypothetical protein n=1 Tax=uncultured Clostridium sp. TaxID=59620 RepID=UPI00261AF929|nr:hypothetical protein [uncultured Clostridium sp.]